MIFQKDGDKLKKYDNSTSSWKPKELEIENLIVSTAKAENTSELNYEIFGENLLFLDNQIKTHDNTRTDIIAIDENGALVIIELKKDEGKLGVEMQALQYLSAFSNYKGEDCLKHTKTLEKRDIINDFLDDNIAIADINKNSRIILIARYFDTALFSMGQWLAEQGVSFKCIAYEPIEIENKQFINFSVVFEQSAHNHKYKLKFAGEQRKPGVFWHNIGGTSINWWKYNIENKVITAGFDNAKGDRGEEILKNYIKGDIVFAYISQKGCVGYGIIEDDEYKLVENKEDRDKISSHGCDNYHMKSISWKAVIPDINKSISSNELRKEFGIAHPIQTSSIIKNGNIEGLKNRLKADSQQKV